MSLRVSSRFVTALFILATCCSLATVAATKHVLLVVLTHGDDDVSIAPLMARYAAEGHTVYYAMFTGVQDLAGQEGSPARGEALCASKALGGRIERMGSSEIGWFTVDSADEDAVPAGPWLEFHEDRCLLPADATVLARNEAAVQAFRIGRHFAVQFHPEVDGPQLKRWLDSMGTAAVQSVGLDPDQFLADTIREEPAARARADRLVATALGVRDS